MCYTQQVHPLNPTPRPFLAPRPGGQRKEQRPMNYSAYAHSRPATLAIPLLLGSILLLNGCLSTREWRDQADERASQWLQQAQQEVNGKTEPIIVESPADTLRRRLLLDQKLQLTDAASLGITDLADTERWQNDQHLRPFTDDLLAAKSVWNTAGPLALSLVDAIVIAARHNRDFQSQKDSLFQTALTLDLEDHQFQNTFTGMLSSTLSSSHNGDRRNHGLTNDATLGVKRNFKNGIELTSSLSVDLVKMLTGDRGSSWGILGDASINIPLLRGAGEFVAAESLTQAQRNLVYAVRDFEQYKRGFIVRIANSYLGVLQGGQRIINQEENYKRVVTSTRRSRRMADAGLLPEYQFDQAVQDELRARDNWVGARLAYEASLDAFKILLGLPPDAKVEPLTSELDALQLAGQTLGGDGEITDYSKVPAADAPVVLVDIDDENTGPYEISADKAVAIALKNRPDLRNALEKIEDAQRDALIAEDSLRAELTIGGRASIGESRSLGQADSEDGSFRATRGTYSAPLYLNLPFERTRERNAYRNSLINLEKTVRNFQRDEDAIKEAVRGKTRNLLENRSRIVIQRQAVRLAERRVKSTDLLLQAGRAAIRDVLEAQNALLSAQNSLISAVVSYRINELELQRDLGVLAVAADGAWQEPSLEDFD